jgi:hypothetical protein
MNKVFVLLALVFVLGSCSSIKTIHSIELPRNSNNKIHQDHVDLIINDRVEKTIDINIYWHTSSPTISLELKRDILKYWNSAVSDEYAIDIS